MARLESSRTSKLTNMHCLWLAYYFINKIRITDIYKAVCAHLVCMCAALMLFCILMLTVGHDSKSPSCSQSVCACVFMCVCLGGGGRGYVHVCMCVRYSFVSQPLLVFNGFVSQLQPLLVIIIL